ncbi:hypothetical protein L6255_03180 [Candidatus Parcubacteria bacterium]|nr:hypothetical protein [Patescibacteria group bacterium]MBU4381193.1 hypothetical protein [Patescibacteria group bacterium]MCG2689415.1 hypothetical protein [Candidatus Parcubacteria bacterium]
MPALYWENGLIKMPFRVWRSPTKRRIPRLLIEGRAKEVLVKLSLKENTFTFEETLVASDSLKDITNKYRLENYNNRFLFPALIGRWDFLDYIKYHPIYIFSIGKDYYFTCSEFGDGPKELPEDWYKKSLTEI